MRIGVISYSLTGNNEKLAKSIAKEFSAEHISINEIKSRKMSTIVLDLIFNRTPRVEPLSNRLDEYDVVMLLGPVWMGKVATPLRGFLKHLKKNTSRYAFISLSGGADGDNPNLRQEIKKLVGREPMALIDIHIADLLPSDPKPTRQDTSDYRVNEADLKKITVIAVNTLSKKMQTDNKVL